MSFDYKQKKAYFRDGFVPFAEANLSIASSPVLYGLSVYTVFNAIWNEKEGQLYVFRLKDHYDRLCNSSKIMGFTDFSKNYNYEQFEKIVIELLSLNTIKENALVRASYFIDELAAGARITGLKNSLSIYVSQMGQFYPKDGANICISSWTRTSDNAIPARAKVNGSYVNAALMKNEAFVNGFDEAIALNNEGRVSEGAVANICMVRDGKIITPSASSDILEGITLNTIKRLAEHAGIDFSERNIDRTELYIAEEIFFTGSSANISPIISVDRRSVGSNGSSASSATSSGKIGKITKQLSDLYDEVRLGKIPEFKDWITKVY